MYFLCISLFLVKYDWITLYIMKICKYDNFIVEMPVPIAIIVCEGDIETISHISKALQNKLPVIVMKGSGMAADLVVDYLEKYVS